MRPDAVRSKVQDSRAEDCWEKELWISPDFGAVWRQDSLSAETLAGFLLMKRRNEFSDGN